jgi:hypothetical protein
MWGTLLGSLFAGAGTSLLSSLFGSDDDSSSSSSSSSDLADAYKYSSKLNLLGSLASALASAQKTEQSTSTDVDYGPSVDTPSLGDSSSTSISYPFTNQYSNTGNTNLAKSLRSFLGGYA